MTEWTEDGRPAAWETTVESPFDDEERESWYALLELEAATCEHCGNLRAVCSTPLGTSGRGYFPTLDYCYVTGARQVAERRFRAKHKSLDHDSVEFLPTDGALISATLADENPDGDFLS